MSEKTQTNHDKTNGSKKKKKKRNKWKRRIMSLLIILVGILLLLYPFISNYLFDHRMDGIINTYEKDAELLSEEERLAMLEAARAYNRNLYESPIDITDPFGYGDVQSDAEDLYHSLLNVDGKGMMCVVEIPKIDVSLPVYHGTTNDVLENGIGHLYGSSLPVGGINTHAVLTGHTGLNRAKLFTDLTELRAGDLFFIEVLSEKLAYEVFDIQVIDPSDVSSLHIREGEDIITLVTCTPYGVNSHRLLVTGQRTEYTDEKYQAELAKENTNTQWKDAYKKALIVGLLIALILFIPLIVYRIIRKKKKKK